MPSLFGYTGKRLSVMNHIVIILIGGFLATSGTVMMAYGWNKFSQKQRDDASTKSEQKSREAILKAVLVEYYVNWHIVNNPRFFSKDDKEVAMGNFYVPFSSTSLSTLVNSGLFNQEKDKELFSRTYSLMRAIADMNVRIQTLNQPGIRTPEVVATLRIAMRDSDIRQQLKARLTNLYEMLTTKYGLSKTESHFVPLMDEDTILPLTLSDTETSSPSVSDITSQSSGTIHTD